MSERIKVVQLITTMADGGAETLVKDYALLCDKEKVDMRIVTWSEPLGSANERVLKEAKYTDVSTNTEDFVVWWMKKRST